MGISTINAGMVKNAFLAGAKGLAAKKEWINELNVFPVPDGDTGTNMTLTIMAAAKEVAGLESVNMETLAKSFYGSAGKGHLFRFLKRSKRKFRRYPFPAFKRIYKRNQNR